MMKDFQMQGELGAVDPMVVRLVAEASETLDAGALIRFELATSEALTNVVRHALAGKSGVVVDLRLSQNERGVALEIFDAEGTAPFDPREYRVDLNDLDITSEDGRGIAIILDCSDKVEYGRKEGRQRLALSFWNQKNDIEQ